jgi:uncharacterized protein HemX
MTDTFCGSGLNRFLLLQCGAQWPAEDWRRGGRLIVTILRLAAKPAWRPGHNNMESEMKTVISALVALVVGAGGMYFYLQGPMKELQSSAATLQAQLAEAKTASEASAAEVTKLQEAGKALEEKASLADSLQAKVTELEAALAAANASTGTAQ